MRATTGPRTTGPQTLHVADTNPYPWPYDGCVDGSNLALLICGAQRELVDASSEAVAVGAQLDVVAEAIRSVGGRVIWIRHGGRDAPSRPTGSLPTRGTAGWQLAVDASAGDEVVDSSGWDGCFGSDLDHTIRAAGLGNIVLGGFASEITVDSTVRTLNDRGHECLVLTDCCAPLDTELGGRAHASLTMSGGIFGALGTSGELLELIHTIQKTHRPDMNLEETLA